jgi:isoleucyl-tRNA synthetase
MIEKYCADAVRWYFYTVNDPGDPKLFAQKDLELARKKFLLTFWNCHVFLKTYAPKIKPPKAISPKNDLDKWIVSRFNSLLKCEIRERLEKYDIASAARKIEDFSINDLSLWYVRRSRRRLQHPKNAAEFNEAAKTFAWVLDNLAKITAPFVPFLSEEIYQELNGLGFAKTKSVHLEAWPAAVEKLIDDKLENEMETVRRLVAWGMAERAKHGVKVRQPLAKLVLKKNELRSGLYDLVKEEINVKEIGFDENLAVAAELDWNITSELKEEGDVREIIRQIQELRKTAKFTPQDKITIYWQSEGELKAALEKNQNLIAKETKAGAVESKKPAKVAAQIEVSVAGQKIWLAIKKC